MPSHFTGLFSELERMHMFFLHPFHGLELSLFLRLCDHLTCKVRCQEYTDCVCERAETDARRSISCVSNDYDARTGAFDHLRYERRNLTSDIKGLFDQRDELNH